MEASPRPFGYHGMNVAHKHVIEEEHILHIYTLHSNYENRVYHHSFKHCACKDTLYFVGEIQLNVSNGPRTMYHVIVVLTRDIIQVSIVI